MASDYVSAGAGHDLCKPQTHANIARDAAEVPHLAARRADGRGTADTCVPRTKAEHLDTDVMEAIVSVYMYLKPFRTPSGSLSAIVMSDTRAQWHSALGFGTSQCTVRSVYSSVV